MKNCMYFVNYTKKAVTAPLLEAGYGFRPDGGWRQKPLPDGADGILIDDRCLPSRRGTEAALAALAQWSGTILLDFERPPVPELLALVRSLPCGRLVCPPCLAELPHAAVLTGPWPGNGGFLRWLAQQQARFGAVVLDAVPLRRRARPGCAREPLEAPPPERGFFCPGALCLHRRLADGSLLFWDTKQSLTARCRAAGVPCVVFEQDWYALPSGAPEELRFFQNEACIFPENTL